VAERSNAGIAHALLEGLARVATAPAVAIGMFAAVRLLELNGTEDWMILGLGARRTILSLMFWSFAYGGVLDRYARNRPTRGYGFFGACGRHVMPLARLSLLPLAVAYAVARFDPGFLISTIVILAVNIVMQFARIRLVVEDRRSAIGSLAAGARFALRNPGAVAILWIAFGLLHIAQGAAYQALSPRFAAGAPATRVVDEASAALAVCLQVLFPYAAATVLFQSRLAHARYTAAPPAVWPESAAAEAIANAEPGIAR
jgi:hypothetical protein